MLISLLQKTPRGFIVPVVVIDIQAFLLRSYMAIRQSCVNRGVDKSNLDVVEIVVNEAKGGDETAVKIRFDITDNKKLSFGSSRLDTTILFFLDV
jgi:hypothetical protein